jgi:hypothetical protein
MLNAVTAEWNPDTVARLKVIMSTQTELSDAAE